MVVVLSLSASNTKGNTKRAVVNTLFFVGYSVACIGGPQLWQTKDAPRYFDGLVLNISALSAGILLLGVYWILCYWGNTRRDKGFARNPDRVYQPGEDITDNEDDHFRYSY